MVPCGDLRRRQFFAGRLFVVVHRRLFSFTRDLLRRLKPHFAEMQSN